MVNSHTSAPPLSAHRSVLARLGEFHGSVARLRRHGVPPRAMLPRQADDCFAEYFSRLPEGTQDSCLLLMKAREDGLPFDEAWADLKGRGLFDEFGNSRDLARGQ